MVELKRPEEADRKELTMASTSCATKSSLPMKETPPNYYPYPPPLAKYEDVVASSALFMSTLENFHSSMNTKFMIPTIGGKELDLHRLFVEVTSRGGIEKIIQERRWKEVTAVFNFPSTATNASFVLRKYYGSLLYHYEQIYVFRAQGWTPISSDSVPPGKTQGLERMLLTPEVQAASQEPRINAAESPRARCGSSTGSPVFGVIDGKFESGYLVTVTIGTEKLKGVLYQALPIQEHTVPHHNVRGNTNDHATATPVVHRRRRRKKSEIKRRDPSHPKPNRSGYNFFFAEQHARLKLLHPGKDREISRMIGELWNKLKDSERIVYQEKAIKDKERYRIEMVDYRERLKTEEVISDAVPLQQRFPDPDVNMMEPEIRIEETEEGYSQTQDNGSSSGKSDSEGDKTIADESANTVMQTLRKNDTCEMHKGVQNLEDDRIEKAGDVEERNLLDAKVKEKNDEL